MAKITIETEGFFSPVVMSREAYDILKFAQHSEMERRRDLERKRDALINELKGDIELHKTRGYCEYYSAEKLLTLVLKLFEIEELNKAYKAEEPEDSEADEEDEDNG